MSKYSIEKETYIDEESKINLSEYDLIGVFKDKVAPVKKNNLWGYIDEKGNEIIPVTCDMTYTFKNGMGRIMKKDEKGITYYGLVNTFGRLVAPLIYEEIGDFSNGLASVKRNGKYGYIDADGAEVIKPRYDEASCFTHDRAIVRKDNDGMLLNTDGKVIAKYSNAIIDSFGNNNYSVVRKLGGRERDGIIDINGNEVLGIQRKYSIKSFSNNLAIMCKENASERKFYIWDNGKIRALPSYDDIDVIGENNLIVTDYNNNSPRGYFYLADLDGNKVSDNYELIQKSSTDMYRVYVDGLWGLVNTFGEEFVKPKYDYISDFNNGVFKVKIDGKWGLINLLGEEITDIKYNMINDFNSKGLAEAKLGSKRGFLNTKGEVVAYYDKTCVSGDDIVSKTIINDRYMLYERVASPKYAIYDLKKNILTDFSFNLVREGEDILIFDNSYIASKDNLKFKYRFVLKNDKKEVIRDFDSIKERNKYYSLASKEIQKADKEYEKRINSVSKKIEKIIYSDLDKQIEGKYKLQKSTH